MEPPRTLPEALEQRASAREAGFTHMALDGTTRFECFQELYRRARRIGRALQLRGVTKGDRLALIVSDSQQFVGTLFGAFAIGAVPVPLALPTGRLNDPDAYLRHVAPAIAKARAGLVLSDPELQPLFTACRASDATFAPALTLDELLADVGPHAESAPVAVGPADTALLQFTSGSTSQPKGVRLTHSNLAENVRAVAGPHCLGCRDDDYCVSWLPLHHDMGLVAKVLMPVYAGMKGGLFMPPAMFVSDPLSWLRQIAAFRGTITFAPNFAFALCNLWARRKRIEGLDLSSLRIVACAAEPIRVEVLSEFAGHFGAHGLRAEALMPCYGLAEHTMCATSSAVGAGVISDRVAAEDLRNGAAVPAGQAQAAINVVNCGRFLSGHQGKIVDNAGRALPERIVGEILLRGPSLMHDYFEDAAATAAALTDGWLHTGDLGYIAGGDLYVCGRSKDVLIIYGQKYHPQDIEWEAEQLEGVRAGCVVAFAVEDRALTRDRIVIAAETRLGKDQHERLQDSIRARIQRTLGIAVDHVVIVAPQTLPKTSSGKLRRSRTRDLFVAGKLTQAAPSGS